MNKTIFAFTVTRAETSERALLLQNTIYAARKTAGMDFTWCIWSSGIKGAAISVVESALATKTVQEVYHKRENIGQHVAWNEAFKLALDGDYDYFLRIDDDCEFPTKRWLAKLVRASVTFDDKFVLSPKIKGLENPPRGSQIVNIKGIPCEFLVDAIGGICRLHPTAIMKDYVSDVRKPMGSGDATGIADYCKERTIPMAYVRHIRVRHAKSTKGQQSDSEHFSMHGVYQHIPYIPIQESTKDVSV